LFFVLSKLLDVFLSPLTWGLLLLAAASPWRRGARASRGWRRRRALAALGVAVLLVASSPVFANAVAWRLEQSARATWRPDVTYDAVIVLGGMGDERVWRATGAPTWNDDVERIMAAERILREGKARFAIVSGGTNDPALARFSEARQLAEQLHAWGVAPDRVVLEDRARNTRENALYSKEILVARGWTRVLVVTSAFHVPRAADCFRAVHVDADFLPVDYRAHPPGLRGDEWLPRAGALAMTTAMVRELFGRLVYRVQGYGAGA
jgi:uncharacterized SAM-binding protein YcdF (DUF218 family)